MWRHPDDVEAELKRTGVTLQPFDIVLVNTAAGARYGEPDYVSRGCGMGRAATLWLTERGVKIAGTDAWSWDAPFVHTAKKYAATRDASLIWEGHRAGIERAYCHIEKLANLEGLPGDRLHGLLLPVQDRARLSRLHTRRRHLRRVARGPPALWRLRIRRRESDRCYVLHPKHAVSMQGAVANDAEQVAILPADSRTGCPESQAVNSPGMEHGSMIRITSGLAAGLLGVGIALSVAVAPTSTATAQGAKLVAGTLTCKGGPTVGLVVGSQQKLDCSFSPAGKGRVREFKATITKVGLDIGFKSESVIVWTVLGSTEKVPSKSLVGNYAGVSAEASVALGAGANALIGGNDKSIVLQPLSVQGQKGLNLAVGVTGLTLSR